MCYTCCKLEFLATRILIHRPQQGQSESAHTMVWWFFLDGWHTSCLSFTGGFFLPEVNLAVKLLERWTKNWSWTRRNWFGITQRITGGASVSAQPLSAAQLQSYIYYQSRCTEYRRSRHTWYIHNSCCKLQLIQRACQRRLRWKLQHTPRFYDLYLRV